MISNTQKRYISGTCLVSFFDSGVTSFALPSGIWYRIIGDSFQLFELFNETYVDW